MTMDYSNVIQPSPLLPFLGNDWIADETNFSPSSTEISSAPSSSHSKQFTSTQQTAENTLLDQIPATFLPSYYPESRNPANVTSESSSFFDVFNLTAASGVPDMGGSNTGDFGDRHTAETVDKISAAGPSTKSLLDGITLAKTPRAPRPSTDSATNDSQIYSMSMSNALGSTLMPSRPSSSGSWASHPNAPWNEGRYQGSRDGLGIIGQDIHEAGVPISSGIEGLAGPSNLALPDQNMTTYSSNTVSPVLTQDTALNPSPRSGNYPSLQNPRPQSSEYPVSLFGNVDLPDTGTPWPPTDQQGQASTETYTQILQIYEHMLKATSAIQPAAASNTADLNNGQPFDTLLQLSANGMKMLSSPPKPAKSKSPPRSNAKRNSLSGSGSGSHKAPPKCLGCGSTSTPEWRRGPMGPRTLCNACGLVHMKLQRKKRKLEEKAAAAAAAKEGK